MMIQLAILKSAIFGKFNKSAEIQLKMRIQKNKTKNNKEEFCVYV